MKNFISKKTISILSFLALILSCKKNSSENQIIQGETSSQAVGTTPLLESRKSLLAIDHINNMDNSFNESVFLVSGLDGAAYKYKIVQGGKNFFIRDICPGPGLNSLFFLYEAKNFLSSDEGVWAVTIAGNKNMQIAKKMVDGTAYELDVDRVNGKVYSGHGSSVTNMTIWRYNPDGSGKEKLLINGVASVGRFAVDGVGKRIFFQYKKDGKSVIGSCDFTGQIIKPVVVTLNFDIDAQIDLDIVKKVIFLKVGGNIFTTSMEGVNQIPTLLYANIKGYHSLIYDFTSSKLFYTGDDIPWRLYASDYKGQNVKLVLPNFTEVTRLTGLFTY